VYEFSRQLCHSVVTQHARKAGSEDPWLCVKCHAVVAEPAHEVDYSQHVMLDAADGTYYPPGVAAPAYGGGLVAAPEPAPRSTAPKHEFKGLDCAIHGQAPHHRERHTLGPWLCGVCKPML
jgi:ribosomal protein L37AE/L43A